MKTDKLLTTPTTTAAATTISLPTKLTTTINNALNSKRPTVIVYPTGKTFFFENYSMWF